MPTVTAKMTMDEALRMHEAIRRAGERTVDPKLAYAMARNRRTLATYIDSYNDVMKSAPQEAKDFSRAVQEAMQQRVVSGMPETKDDARVLVQDPQGLQKDIQLALKEWPNGQKLLDEFNAKLAALRGEYLSPSPELIAMPLTITTGFPISLVEDLFPMLFDPDEPTPAPKP
jgi:hypothetical protein